MEGILNTSLKIDLSIYIYDTKQSLKNIIHLIQWVFLFSSCPQKTLRQI